MEPSREVVALTWIGNGRYVVTDRRTPLELRLSRWRSRAVALVGSYTYQLRRTGILDRGVVVLDPAGNVLLHLSHKHPNVPGLPDCQWRVRARFRGYEARLTDPGVVELVARTGYGRQGNVTMNITGTLPSRELVLLAAAFAVLLRRREDTEAAVAAATSTVAVSS